MCRGAPFTAVHGARERADTAAADGALAAGGSVFASLAGSGMASIVRVAEGAARQTPPVTVPVVESPLRRWWQWGRTRRLALLAVAVVLPIALVTTRGTLDWLDRPFPGFFVMGNGIVPTVGVPGWPGLAAGIPFHARVVAADDQPVRTNADVYAHVEARPVGTPVRWTLEKGGDRFTRTAPTMRFGPRDYWLTVGLLALFGYLSCGAGIVVAILQPRRRAAQAFLAQGVLNGLFALTGTALYHPALQSLAPAHFVLQASFPAAFVHLAFTFPVERDFIARRPAWLVLPYLVSAALSVWILLSFFAAEPNTTALHASYVWVSVGLAFVIGTSAYAYGENRTPVVRSQLHAVLPGLVLGSSVALFGFLDNARGGGVFPINFVAATPLLFFLSVGWAITRHELFDVDELVRRGALYATFTLLVTAVYAGSVALLDRVLPLYEARTSTAFNIAFVVLVASVFEPLRVVVQRGIDRAFFRSRPDYRHAVGEVSSALTSLLDLDEIFGRVGHTVTDGLQPRSVAFLLWIEDGARVYRYHEVQRRVEETDEPSTGALRALLDRPPRAPWRLPDHEESPAGDDPRLDPVRHEMDALGAVLLVPLTAADRVIGALALGPRRSGRPFSSSDVELLRTLAAQSAIAIQNALSYEAVRTLNAELETRVRARTAALESSYADLDRALRELKSTQAQLLQSEKLASLGQLVAGVAHEINNPVSFIVGNVEPLRQHLDTLRGLAARYQDAELAAEAERVRRILEIIARGAERTAGIVNDLRTFSRVGEGHARPTDLHEGLEMSIRLLRPKWSDRIEIHRDFGTLPPVSASPGPLNQVFMNLLSNACDAIDGRGNVWVRTRCDDGYVTVTVRDDGRGIAPDVRSRIFDPFFTTKPPGKGTGLGLAISYGIVQQHGGSITVSSEPGRGTEFEVKLPLRLA